jgi:acido-empty-quinoprotein group A
MKIRHILPILALALPASIPGQGLTNQMLLKPPADSWPMYNGDYSGRRYSPLKVINDSNVQNLSLDWTTPVQGGTPLTPGPGAGAMFPPIPPMIHVAGTPLMVNGFLYFTATDNAWCMDAMTGRVIWHYYRQSHGDEPMTGNRGFGMYGRWLYFMTRDNFLVSLDAISGRQRFIVPVADPKQYYFSTVPPMVIGNHIIVGTGGDSLDIPGFLQSRDPETGDVQWTRFTQPRAGEPGIETWPDEYAASHGGGGPWIPGTYDPELSLYYVGTGNPNPLFASQSRKGDNLYTCSILAINPDTGKIVWYFQSSPHDTHDWDAVQTPVIFDGVINGQPRKLLAQASRNGYFFVLDRTNGKNILTVPFGDAVNWAKGIDAKGQPIPNPLKEASLGGVLVSPSTGGVTGWSPPAFNPDTGLFYASVSNDYSVYYLTDTDDHPEGYGGKEASGSGLSPNTIRALDYKTGKVAWQHDSFAGGMLTTAGNLLFSASGLNFVAYNAANGKILWHAGLAAQPNAPITYMLNGKQHVLVISGNIVYSFVLNQ